MFCKHTFPIKKMGIATAATLLLCVVSTSHAEVFPDEALIKIQKEKAGGGLGSLAGKYAFTRDKASKEQAIKEVSWLTLAPGNSIGYHLHTDNEDAYIIVSGTGIFKDQDGKDYPVKAGDVTVVRKGESHGLANTGNVPLVFVDVIAQQ